MNSVVPFDTLAFAKALETAGIPTAHAEAQAKAIAGAFQKVEEFRFQELATKGDMLRLEKEIEVAKSETIKWTAGMFAAQTVLIIGAMFAVMKMNQPVAQPALYQPPIQELRQPAPAPAAPLAPPPAPAR